MNTVFYGLILLLNVTLLHAQALTPEHVPEPLKPWIDWVLHDEIERDCPFLYNQYDQKQCGWPAQLTLELNPTQGRFVSHWHVYQDSWVFLPGDEQYWPQQVMLNQQPAVVIAKEGRPSIKLMPGQYEIKGSFNWDFIPEQLRIPDNTGLIKLSINNTPIALPSIKEGLLWLKDSERGAVLDGKLSDKLDLQVFRQVIDDVPLQLLTHIELDVAGSAREVKLSQALLHDFIAMRLDSPLPARLEADGQLVVQVRPGHWQLTLLARQATPADSLALQPLPNWPSTEVWAFAAQPSLRVVEVTDLPAIDPTQTNLPADWQSLPAYRIQAGQAMHFKLMRRGNPDPEPNQLSLKRQLWLDFDGLGYTMNDQISGTMTRDWRLNVLAETALGKVSLNTQSQLITRSASGDVGFEVREGSLNVQADSRYQGNISDISVTGWQQTFHQVTTDINLPPGWRLFAASGVDNVPDSWVTRWTLLDIFMVLIASLAVAHLYPNLSIPEQHGHNPEAAAQALDQPPAKASLSKSGILWGLFTLITLTLTWHEPEAPQYSWLQLLAVTALVRLVPPSKLLRLLSSYRKVCTLALILLVIPFMIAQVRIGLHPQLEMPWQIMQGGEGNQPAAVPASPVMDMQDNSVTGMPEKMLKMRSFSEGVAKSDYYVAQDKPLERIDPQANVQTGPGLPQWHWHTIQLAWNGSVDSQQRVTLWYLSPAVNGVLSFLRVALVAALALLLFGRLTPPFSGRDATTKLLSLCVSGGLGILLIPALLLSSEPANADFPPQTVLDDLKTRLLAAPDCLPNCAQIAQAQIHITPELLQVALQIDAQAAVAIPLPAQQRQWLPENVVLDGVINAPLIRDAEGQLWLQVTKGRHQLIMQGRPPALDKFSLALPLKPHHVTVAQTGWEQTGVHEHGIADAQLQFTRVDKTAGSAAAQAAVTLPALFRIERTLQLGLDWRVITQVIRLTPADSAVLLTFPLLPGESVLSPGFRVDKQQVLLNIEAAQAEVRWESVLEKTAQLELTAMETQQWTEVWRVNISPIWHLDSQGIAPVHPGQPSEWQPEWRPWPGEKVTLQLTRPEAITGQTLTMDYSQLTVAPGKRITENTLLLKLKSSKGGQHPLTLPAEAALQSVSIDGILQPLRQENRTVTLPVKPGEQTWQLVWQQPQILGTRFNTPNIDLGVNSVNSHIKLTVAADRWVLYAIGPRLGPAVLFWGFLLVIALLALGLHQTKLTPLKQWHWFLLLLGLSQLAIEYALLVVAWLCLLGLRRKQPMQQAFYFNALQLLLIALTLAAGVCLFLAVEKGLLGSPEMQIRGNQSTAYDLNWYQDRTDKQLPIASVISVPLWVYRGLMLVWSLWLAVYLLIWLKWGWQCFAVDGLWRKAPPKTPVINVEEAIKPPTTE